MKQSLIDKASSIHLHYDYLAPGLVSLFENEKNDALGDELTAARFVEKATDIECLAVLSEVSLRGPLSDIGYKLMMHLSSQVFTKAGLTNIPDFIASAEKLDRYHEDHLERLRYDIRKHQARGSKLAIKHLEL